MLSPHQNLLKAPPTASPMEKFACWMRLRKYRIEVTYGVYVYTPAEKAIFWALFIFLFTLISAVLLLYTERRVVGLSRVAVSYIQRNDVAGSLAKLVSHLLTQRDPMDTSTTDLKSQVELGAANSQTA
ncbi:hypothetical protein F5Y15DRAFT_164875 [Xylariaceae sp. FL0016]|nr:hypothetical protein F5Y15DRAFT_164875 [Xylariaceae sp. FL0016]